MMGAVRRPASVEPSAEIKRQVLEQQKESLQAKAYDLEVQAEMAVVQATFYEGRRAQFESDREKNLHNSHSLYACVARLQEMLDELSESGDPPTESPGED